MVQIENVMQRLRKGFSIEYHLINDVLMEWNPIGVIGSVLMDEYVAYIPRLIRVKENSDLLLKELEIILTKDMGIRLDPLNAEKKQELVNVARKINAIR